MTEFCHLWLACESEAEASKIAKALLDRRLIACAKQLPITSDYWWKGEQEHAEEVLLVMESRTDFFEKIDSLVGELHSYETFSLQAIPLIRISPSAEEWLTKETKQ